MDKVFDKNGLRLEKGNHVVWYDPDERNRQLDRVWCVDEIRNEENILISDEYGECEVMQSELSKEEWELTNQMNPLYDDVQDLTNRLEQYCGFANMDGMVQDDETKVRMQTLQSASSDLANAAKELLDHLVWDKVIE